MKKKMFLSLLLSASAMLALASCGDDKTTSDGNSNNVVDNSGNKDEGGSTGQSSQSQGNNSGSSEGQGGQGQGSDSGQSEGGTAEIDAEIDFGEAATVEEVKLAATNKSTSVVNAQNYQKDSANDVVSKLVLKLVKYEITESTTTDITTLKTELNEYYADLVYVINALNSTKTAVADVKEEVENSIAILRKAVVPFVPEINRDYMTVAFDSIIKNLDKLTVTEIRNQLASISVGISYVSEIEYTTEFINAIKQYQQTVKQLYDYAKEKAANLGDTVNNKIQEYYDYIVMVIGSTTTESFIQYLPQTIKEFKTKLLELSGDLVDLTFNELKELVTAALSSKVYNVVNTTDSQTAKGIFAQFLTEKLAEVNSATSIAELKTLLADINSTGFLDTAMQNALTAVRNEIKNRITTLFNSLKNCITDTEVIAELDSSLSTYLNAVDSTVVLDNCIEAEEAILNEVLPYIKGVAGPQIEALFNNLSSIIKNEDTIVELLKLKDTMIAGLNAENTSSIDFSVYFNRAKSSILYDFKLDLYNSLVSIADEVIPKLPNKLAEDLTDYLIDLNDNDISNISYSEMDDSLRSYTESVTLKCKELMATALQETRSAMKTYLNTLVNKFSVTPYSYLPTNMNPENNIETKNLNYDFSDFVNVTDIATSGYGEQLHMVTDNIDQIKAISKFLNGPDAVLGSALSIATAYLDGQYCDSLSYIYENENLSFEIDYDTENGLVTFNVTSKKSIDMSKFGTLTPTIEMSYNISQSETTTHIHLTDSNMVKFVVGENKYKFAVEYGIDAGHRTSYFELERDGSDVTGNIYEYITIKGKDLNSSCADFYVSDGYVTVVGNKADGIKGMDGYIVELYDATTGELIAYEVRETKTIAKATAEYNTYWFDLKNISGINNLKIVEEDKQDRSTIGVYLNNSSTLFKPTYNKLPVIGTKTSRKYDIEYRTRYFYTQDGDGNIIENEIIIPMMFIQADNLKDTNYTDYPADVLDDNGLVSSVTFDAADKAKLDSNYATLIADFIDNKQMMSSDAIIEYITE